MNKKGFMIGFENKDIICIYILLLILLFLEWLFYLYVSIFLLLNS